MRKITNLNYFDDDFFRKTLLSFIFSMFLSVKDFGKTVREQFINLMRGELPGKGFVLPINRADRILGYETILSLHISLSTGIKMLPLSQQQYFEKRLMELAKHHSYQHYRDMNARVVGKDGVTLEPVWTAHPQFLHDFNKAGDACYHIHEITPGMVKTICDGQYRSLDATPFFKEGYESYRRALFNKMAENAAHELGLKTKMVNEVLKLDIPSEKLRVAGLMQRSEQINSYMKEHNIPEHRRFVAVMRTRKNLPNLDPEQARQAIRDKLPKLGIPLEQLRSPERIFFLSKEQTQTFANNCYETFAKEKTVFDPWEFKHFVIKRSKNIPIKVEELLDSCTQTLELAKERQKVEEHKKESENHHKSKADEPRPTYRTVSSPKVSKTVYKRLKAVAAHTFQQFSNEFKGMRVLWEAGKTHFIPEWLKSLLKGVNAKTIEIDAKEGGVEKLLKELLKTPRSECHRAAINAVRDPELYFNTFRERLRYGEKIYKQTRKPIETIDYKTTVIVQNAEYIPEKLLEEFTKKIYQAKAIPVFVDLTGKFHEELRKREEERTRNPEHEKE